MNERMICLDMIAGETTVTLGNGSAALTVPVGMTIVAVVVNPSVNDSGLTIDIQDDTADIITAIACATFGTPGTWISTALGGTQTPVYVAADSILEMDVNNAAANTRVHAKIYALTGEGY